MILLLIPFGVFAYIIYEKRKLEKWFKAHPHLYGDTTLSNKNSLSTNK
jgi:hypothetical protein